MKPLETYGRGKLLELCSAADDDASGELTLKEFIDAVKDKGSGFQPKREEAKRLFDLLQQLVDEEEGDEEDDPFELVEQLLRGVSQHKWRLEQLRPAGEVVKMFAPANSVPRRAPRAGAVRRSNSSSRRAGQRRGRGASAQPELDSDPVEILTEVAALRTFIEELSVAEGRPGGSTDGHVYRDIQRMRGNFCCALSSSLRRRLVDYVDKVRPLAFAAAKQFVAEIEKEISEMDRAAANPRTRPIPDQPYGIPAQAPSGMQGLRAACSDNLLEKFASVLSSPESELASAHMSSGLASKPLLLNEFKILVVDDAASRILSRCSGTAQLVERGICMVEDITQERTAYSHLEAVYCVSPTPHSVNHIARDFQAAPGSEDGDDEPTKYKAAHVIFTGPPPSTLLANLVDSLGVMLGTVEQMRMEFLSTDDLAFDLGMGNGEKEEAIGLEDIELAPHQQYEMAEKLSQVCIRLGMNRPVIRWHDAAASDYDKHRSSLTDVQERASQACSELAELTHKKLLDAQSGDVIQAEEQSFREESIDSARDDLRKHVVARNRHIERQRAARPPDAGGQSALYEGMELDPSTVRQKFGLHYVEGVDYDFELRFDSDRTDYVLESSSDVPLDRHDDDGTQLCDVVFRERSTGFSWELQYKMRPWLDWGTAGTRDAGVHMYDFRLWRQDAGLERRRDRLEQLDRKIEQAERDLVALERQVEHDSAPTSSGGSLALYDAPADGSTWEMLHESQVRRAEAAGLSRTQPHGQYKPDTRTGVLVVHRLIDVIAPLMHDATYEAACMDLLDEHVLQRLPRKLVTDLHKSWNASKDPKPGKKPKRDWIDHIEEEEASELILDGLRTTTNWPELRHKTVFNLLEEVAQKYHAESQGSTPTVTKASWERDFSHHQPVLAALHEESTSRNLQMLCETEAELVGCSEKTARSLSRGAAETGALWQRARESAELDIPALRRLLSKVTDINDKARVALIFVLMRWDTTEDLEEGDAWDEFYAKHKKRDSMFTARAPGDDDYVEDDDADKYTQFWKREKVKERLMVHGRAEEHPADVDLADLRRWRGTDATVKSCDELEKLKEGAFIPGTEDENWRDPDYNNGYTRDERQEQEYRREWQKKWSIFKKDECYKQFKLERFYAPADDSSVYNFTEADDNFRDRRESKRRYKEEMRDMPDGAYRTAVHNAMERLYRTRVHGNQWATYPAKRPEMYAQFKPLEQFFNAHYAWVRRQRVPKDTVLADPWLKKLFKSLKIPLGMLRELARTFDGPIDRDYGYRARRLQMRVESLKSAAKPSALHPTVYHVGRDFAEGKLCERHFPPANPQAPRKHLTSKSASGRDDTHIARHPSQPLAKLVIFVIGGMSLWEMRAVRQLAKELKCEIVIGSTEVAKPQRTMDLFEVAPTEGGLEQAETTGGTARSKRFLVKSSELDDLFDLFGPKLDGGGQPTIGRRGIEEAVAQLRSKLNVKHKSALSRALKAADKDPNGEVDKANFKIMIENIIQIDELMDEFRVADADYSCRLSDKDFRRAYDVAREFIGGSKATTAECDREFRRLSIDGYVLFDEFVDWMTDRRARQEQGQKPRADASKLATRAPGPTSPPPPRPQPEPEPEPEPEQEHPRHRPEPEPEPQSGPTAAAAALPEPEPEPEPEPPRSDSGASERNGDASGCTCCSIM